MQLKRRLALAAMTAALLWVPPTARANLAAWFKFDGTVADQTGQHPGTLYGTTNYVSGIAGQALSFSLNTQGQPTYVEIANPDAIDFGKDFSVSLWLKATSTAARTFLSKNVTNAWAFPGKQFMTSNRQLWADCNSAGDFIGDFATNGVNPTDGQWHHVVVTYAATISPYWTWYADGYRQDSYGRDFTLAPDASGQHLRIGLRENGYPIYFLGQMDELQIYDQTLTSNQVQYLFHNPGASIPNASLPFTNTNTVFPRASMQASTNMSTINVDGLSTTDLFMTLTLQGCVNRTQPRIYLVGHGIVEMQGALSTQFWLDQMTGCTKTNYTDTTSLIRAFTNTLNGCVLYDPTVFSSTSDNNLARINLVIMLCAKYGAVALTPAQSSSLAAAQITLPVLADARTLGTTWKTIYNYALANLAPNMRKDVLHHLGGKNGTNFCLGNVDYLVAQKIFTFNLPVTTTGAGSIQSNILAVTASNTPVIGVWGLDYGDGEHAFVSLISGVGKFLTVTYETENLSFTTGLPLADIPDQAVRPLVLDTNKVYVSFIKTDGDNFSFIDRSWPVDLNVTNRIRYPFAWSFCPTANELNPLVATWHYRNLGSTFVSSCNGVGYEWNRFSTTQNPHEPYLAPFLKLTDSYMAAMKQTFVRNIWWEDYRASLPYGALAHANGVHIGYTGTGIAVSNVQSAAFISRGKAFFQGYDFTADMTNIARYTGPTPAFFSVGHHEVVASLVSACDALSSRFVVVSPDELANLYRQYKTNDVLASQNITGAEFNPLDASELLYLYNVEGAETNSTAGGSRCAHGTNFWIYQFNLDPRVTNATIQLTLYNNYLVSASTNGANWQVIASSPTEVDDASNLGAVTVDVTRFLGGAGKNLYFKFADARPAAPGGVGLTHAKLVNLSGPIFTSPPQNQTALVGSTASFNAAVSGTPPLSYQWYFNGTNAITNATSTALTLTNITSTQAGAYTLVASNAQGAASASANLTVYLPLTAQSAIGQWPISEGAGTNLANNSTNTSNWAMTIQGNPALWGYWQPGAYAFAQGNNNAKTALTAASAWKSGDTLLLKADFNVCGNLHDAGSVFAGGAIFGAGYFTSGGNAQGYNYGAFYALVSTATPAHPTIEFDFAGIAPGAWSQPLPTSITNAGINGGWNTAEWWIYNDLVSNSMTLQFRLNGTNVGGPTTIAGGYLRDFPSYSGYTGTKFYIGAAADQAYKAFQGSIRNVSLVAVVPAPTLALTVANGYANLTIFGMPGFSYELQYSDFVTDWTAWQSLTNVTLAAGSYTCADALPTDTPARFYRAVVVP